MSLSRVLLFTCLVLIPIFTFASTSPHDVFWIGPDNGLWSDPSNWSLTDGGLGGAGPPAGGANFTVGDDAHVGAASTQIIVFDSPNPSFGILDLGSPGTGTTTLDVSQGGLSCDVEQIGPGGIQRQSSGTIFIQTSLSTTGSQTASCAYFLSGTGQVRAENIAFGDNTNIFQSGGAMIGIATGTILHGTSTYFISGGVVGGEATITAPATLIQSGGNVGGFSGTVIGSKAQFGIGTGTAIYELRGGTVGGGNVTVAYDGPAILNQSGGLVNPSGNSPSEAHFDLGHNPGSIGIFNLSAGTVQTSFLRDGLNGTGQINMTGGTMTVGDFTVNTTSSLSLKGGTVSTQSLVLSGSAYLAPQNSITLRFYFQASTGSLDLELNGDTPNLYAHLNPSLSAALSGNLAIALSDNFTPSLGDTFDLIDSPSLTGTFSSYTLPPLDNGLQWQPLYTPTSFSLSVVVPEPSTFLLLPLLLLRRLRRLQNNRAKFKDFS